MAGILSGFKEFLFRGNIIDLAVAVIIGLAFQAVIDSLVTNLITPIIAAIVGEPSFAGLNFKINGAVFGYGAFLDALISFVSIAAAVYFFVVVPSQKIMARTKGPEAAAAPTTKACPECLSEIPIEAKRCAHCAQPVAV